MSDRYELPSLEEAYKWAEQPLDRCVDQDLPALKAFHVLAAEVKRLRAENYRLDTEMRFNEDQWNFTANVLRNALKEKEAAEAKLKDSVPMSIYIDCGERIKQAEAKLAFLSDFSTGVQNERDAALKDSKTWEETVAIWKDSAKILEAKLDRAMKVVEAATKVRQDYAIRVEGWTEKWTPLDIALAAFAAQGGRGE